MKQTPPTALFVCAATIFCSMSILPVRAVAQNVALQTLIDAENNFAHMSAERGIRAAFLDCFADDALMFAPGPTNGKKFWRNYDDKDRQLIWQPTFAAIARSNDFGVTCGPWEMRQPSAGAKAIAFGEFVSVWQKKSGVWKVIFDTGVDHAQPSDVDDEVESISPNERAFDVDLARRGLDRSEKSLHETMSEGAGSALMVAAAEQIRVLRENVFPAIGKAAAKLMLSSDTARMTRKTLGGSMSVSGDLAYRYGSYSAERGNLRDLGHFLTIWRAESEDDWKVIVDLQKKDPAKKP